MKIGPAAKAIAGSAKPAVISMPAPCTVPVMKRRRVTVSPSNAPAFYVVRQTVAGTAATTLAGQPHDPSTTVTSSYNLICNSGNGTFSATGFLRYGGLATTAGGMLIWTFYDEPLQITPGSGNGITIVNANATGGTTGTFGAYFCWDE